MRQVLMTKLCTVLHVYVGMTIGIILYPNFGSSKSSKS